MMSLKKRIASCVFAIAVAASSLSAVAPTNVKAEVMPGVTDMGRQVAADGCVLLKNENAVLPLENGVSISVFGRAQCNYYRCGLGSGGDVKVPYTVDMLEAFRKSPHVKLNEDLVKIYADWAKEHPIGTGTWGENATCEAEMPLEEAVAEEAAEVSDVAVVIIGRTAGEDREGIAGPGGYMLQKEEEDMLRVVTETFEKVVVVMNVPTVMDMGWEEDYDVDSIIYTWHGGMNGGDAAVDVLTGVVNPSGRLADTIAKSYEDYPSAETFGTKGYTWYNEDIYVGYRYFETFEEAKDKVAYPFGYGISYTTFDTEVTNATDDGENISVSVKVTNTGDRAGKETVQVYYGAPQGTLGNPAKELIAFAKTKELAPGESQNIKLSFRINEMAPYDDSGASGHDSCYVLEEGDYKIYVGDNVRSSELAYTYVQEKTEVVKELEEVMAPVHDFNRLKPVENEDGTLTLGEEAVPKETVDIVQKIKDESAELPVYEPKTDEHYTMMDLYNGKITTEEFVAQMSIDDMISLAQGVNSGSAKYGYVPGVAAAFGGVETYDFDGSETTLKEKYGIPVASMADGPSGIRQTAQATLLPCEAAIACTWDTNLVQRMFELEGQEMVLNHIDTLLGPGMNIHRNPIGGRNFEYYSEDPLITGKMASATTLGMQKSGATVTIKHFAANNQETDRRDVDSRVSERALRQIYLKGYEIAVKEGKVRSIMTSYNPINGLWTASNYYLNTTVLRGEWGYTGMVMTDWWGDANETIGVRGGARDGYGEHLSSMIKSQNDLYTPIRAEQGNRGIAIDCLQQKDAKESYENGELTKAELQRGAINLCNYLVKSQAFADLHGIEFKPFYETGEDWFKVERDVASGDPRLSEITIGGRAINTFNKYVTEYKVFSAEGTETLPAVDAKAEDGTTFTVKQATKDHPVAYIYASEGGDQTIYRIIYTSEEGVEPVFDNPVYATLKDIKVNGKSVGGFDSSIMEYTVAVDDLSEQPVIDCTPSTEGVTTEVSYDEETKIATIKCVSIDQVNNYVLKIGEAPKSDEFDELSDAWTVNAENAANWKMEDGHLVISTERGSLWGGQSDLKNYFTQSAYGDWEVEAKLDLEKLPNENYQSLGIAVMQDNQNYIYSKIEHGGGVTLKLYQEKNGGTNDLEALSNADVAKFTNAVYFRIKKLGNTYTASVSPDGENYIRYYTAAYADYAEPKVALMAGNGDQNVGSINAAFDYVRFTTDSVVAETTEIGENTQLKLAEMEPAAISSMIRPARDDNEGMRLTNCNGGEYAVYNIDVEKTGLYDLTPRLLCNASDLAQINFLVYVDDVNVAEFVTQGTEGKWETKSAQPVKLTAGEHKLKVYFHLGGIELNWLQFKLTETLDEETLSSLETGIKEAKQIDLSAYTDASRKTFENALAAAEKAFKNGTQEEIDKAIAELAEAKAGLALKPQGGQPGTGNEGSGNQGNQGNQGGSGENKDPQGGDKDQKVMVQKVKVTGISKKIAAGKKVTLKATVTPANATDKSVKWTSSNTKWATVNSKGVVKTKKAGAGKTVTITATATDGSGKKATYKVKIMKHQVKSISLKASKTSVKAGQKVTVKATVKTTGKKVNKTLKWTSSNTKWATVTSKGVVKTKKAGKGKTVKITAASTDGTNKKKVIRIKIK